MAKFKNKYRIESTRYPKWDYGWNGVYFITICTKNREMYGVTKFATMNNIDFAWQPRFHDHIIRDKSGYNRIEKYIRDNPANWGNDKLYK